ncbi:hypothetical protein AAKU67_004507 [Oxalobacteraceae bacterium GrIS 2.11]
MFKRFLIGGAGFLVQLLSASAFADDPTITEVHSSIITASGFGTFGVVQTNTDNGIFTTGQQKHGATKTADFGPDTKVGAQLDAKFNNEFQAT